MPSDHARIRRDIWADTDWRRLSAGEQWLYLHLLSSPTLSLCGVADWRPARIAKMAAGTSADDVEHAIDAIASLHTSDALRQYVVDLVAATRSHPSLRLGASPRSSLQLTSAWLAPSACARARAAMARRFIRLT